MRVVYITLLIASTAIGCARVHSNVPSSLAAMRRPASHAIEERPDSADVSVERHGVLHVSAECAYDVLADITRWDRWDRSIVATRRLDGANNAEPLAVGARFRQEFDGFTAHSRVLEARRGHILRWRGAPPQASGPVGVHTWTFVSRPDGNTTVINDEHFHAWYLRPAGWFSDFGISDQFDNTIADLDKEAQYRCGG